MSRSIIRIEQTQQLASELETVGSGPLAIDTEADSFHHYSDSICLVQLTFSGRDLLVDPLAGVDLEPLRAWLERPDLTKILHGADYDLRLFHRDHGFEVSGLFDTMIASRLTGERAFGLSALLEKFLDVKLDKRFQRADWSLRPLPPEMADYAAMDTRHLQDLAGLLTRRLEELGRLAWAEEEFRRLEQVRWSGARQGNPWQRVKGSQRLNRRELAVLRAVFELRDAAARSKDVPPFKILRNDVLLALAELRPVDEAALRQVPGLPRGWSSGERARRLVEAVGAALGLAEDELPAQQKVERRKRDPERDARLRSLCRERDRIAETLELESSLLASRARLDEVLARSEAGQAWDAGAELRAWQLELLRPALGPLLDG